MLTDTGIHHLHITAQLKLSLDLIGVRTKGECAEQAVAKLLFPMPTVGTGTVTKLPGPRQGSAPHPFRGSRVRTLLLPALPVSVPAPGAHWVCHGTVSVHATHSSQGRLPNKKLEGRDFSLSTDSILARGGPKPVCRTHLAGVSNLPCSGFNRKLEEK